MDERIGAFIEAKDVDGLLQELEEHELSVCHLFPRFAYV